MSDGLLVVCSLWAITALASQGFGSWIWWLDLFNHGVFFTFVLCALGSILAMVVRRTWVGWVLLAVALLQVMRWAPWPVANPEGGQPLTVLLANVLSSNPDHQALLALIEAEDPDVVGLLEVNNAWLADFHGLRASFPYHLEHPRKDNFGIALYSRVPLQNLRVEWIGHRLVPSISAELPQGVALTLTHPVPPVSGEYSRYRNTQLRDLHARMAGDRWIVFGDLNATPWSAWFPPVPVRGGLPWPTFLGWYGIPIDWVLAGPAIGFDQRRVGPPIGSDHRPVIARLRLPATVSTEDQSAPPASVGATVD